MVAMHSEILLVDRSAGQLYSWSCEQGVTTATPHPLIKELGLTDEHIVQLASSSVRATIVTRSNKIATFHDRLLQSKWHLTIVGMSESGWIYVVD